MREKDLITLIARIETEYKYEEEIVFSKFLKKHGEDYSSEEFINFLRKRYEIINRYHLPD